MKEIIDRVTLEAIRHYGDAATQDFYRRLSERRLSTTRCGQCGEIAFPPRRFCPACHGQAVEWIDLPRRGRLHAFTQQQRSLRFSAPDVVGLVELDGVGRLLSRIDAPFGELTIGQELELDFFEICPGLVVHQFRPA